MNLSTWASCTLNTDCRVSLKEQFRLLSGTWQVCLWGKQLQVFIAKDKVYASKHLGKLYKCHHINKNKKIKKTNATISETVSHTQKVLLTHHGVVNESRDLHDLGSNRPQMAMHDGTRSCMRGWRDGSTALPENPCSVSSIASQFLTVSPVPRDPKLSSGLCRHHTHTVHRHRCWQNSLTHKKNQ